MIRVAQRSPASAAVVEQRTELGELGFDVETTISTDNRASSHKCFNWSRIITSYHTIRNPCHGNADSILLLTNHPPMPVELAPPWAPQTACLPCQMGWLS